MFVALRDLRAARGRFLLISAVVALITALVGFLSGLTGGLADRNVSAVLALPADRIVLAAPAAGADGPAFADSALSAAQIAGWASVPGVHAVHPIGISQARAESGTARAPVAVLGVPPGLDALAPQQDGVIGLSAPAAAQLGVTTGGTVTIAGTTYRVGVVGDDSWYSHVPVVQLTLADWRAHLAGDGGAAATALAVQGSADWAAADAAWGTSSSSVLGSLTAIGAFRSEIGSLLLIVGLLFGISGLVVGAFFTVWGTQRRGDVAVLKALGAGTRSLVRDALGQAAVVLVVGITAGLLPVVLLGTLVEGGPPFLLSPLTTLLPAGLMVVLGLLGAAASLRAVTSADPLTALGSNR